MGMMGNNNGGFFGNNALEGIIALIVVAAIFGNGNFGFGGFGGNNGAGYVASTAERDLLAHMIQRNGTDLSQLAQSINLLYRPHRRCYPGCSNTALQPRKPERNVIPAGYQLNPVW